MSDVFNSLNKVNVQEFIEKKNGLSYLTWSKAWESVKSRYSDASYKIIKNEIGLPYFYDPATGYMVMTEVTVNGETLEMWLPVMDYKNKAMVEPSMTDINKTLMRCLAKNIAMFGLGLYVYAGQDLPTEEDSADNKAYNEAKKDAIKTKEVEESCIGELKAKVLMDKIKEDNVDLNKLLEKNKVESLDKLTMKQFMDIKKNWSADYVGK